MSAPDIKRALLEKAKQEGFDQLGITKPDIQARNVDGLSDFLQQGWHGSMDWMEEKLHRRKAPAVLWPEVKSIIMLTMNYGPEVNPLPDLEKKHQGVISVYAKGKDYHDIVKKKLKNIARWFVGETGAQVKVFVDTAPVMEKPLSMQAGIGWQGKHTNLVSREIGSWGFIGAIFTTQDLEPDAQEQDHCGSCEKCLDICPTKAFPSPYRLDARRCISYLTIEHKGPIPHEFRSKMGNRIYGCDDCLAVCPWNKFASKASEQRFHARQETDNPPLAQLLTMDDQAFRTRFKGTPIKRTGRDRFLRNCLIAAGNSKTQTLKPILSKIIQNKQEPALVRTSAIWAYKKLSTQEEASKLQTLVLANETDQDVINEWKIRDQHDQ